MRGPFGVKSTQKTNNCINFRKRKKNVIMKLKYFYRRNLVVKQNHFIACSDTDKQPPQKPLLSWAQPEYKEYYGYNRCYPNIFWAATTCRHFSWIFLFFNAILLIFHIKLKLFRCWEPIQEWGTALSSVSYNRKCY